MPLALIVIAPITEDQVESASDAIAQTPTGPGSPFALLPSTHFARWVVLANLLDADDDPVEPRRPYLLFCADLDGSLEDWATSACERAGPQLDRVWRHCEGYPGSGEVGRFLDYLRVHQVSAGFSICSYSATVDEIRASLTLQRQLRELAELQQGLSPAELRRVYGARFG